MDPEKKGILDNGCAGKDALMPEASIKHTHAAVHELLEAVFSAILAEVTKFGSQQFRMKSCMEKYNHCLNSGNFPPPKGR